MRRAGIASKSGDQEFPLKVKFHRQIVVKLDKELILGNYLFFPIFDIDSKRLLKL
jgi:hypothetical protein